MDFKRIEWIFFVAFLGLNIFLFGIYREGVRDESNVSYSDQTDSIEERLAKDGITYKGTLSSKKMEGYYLSGEQTNFYDEIQKKRASEDPSFFGIGVELIDNTLVNYPQVTYYIDVTNVTETLATFLEDKNSVLFGKEYRYLPEFSNFDGEAPELIASQSYKNIPFKDDTAQMTLTLEVPEDKSSEWEKVTKYTQTHIQGIEELRDKMDLYSNRDAIETLYVNNKIPSKSKITFLKLAYSRIYKIREKNVYVPVWFIGITTNDGILQIEQVNAMSNSIISTNTIPKVENQ